MLALLAAAVVLLALAAATFILSYTGIHVIALGAGVPPRLARAYPGLLDAALVIASLAAIMLRDGRWWARWYAWLAIIVIVAIGGGTDALHAMKVALPHRQTAGVVAVVPWLLLLLAFSLWLTVLRQSRRAHHNAAPRGAVPAPHGPVPRSVVRHPAPTAVPEPTALGLTAVPLTAVPKPTAAPKPPTTVPKPEAAEAEEAVPKPTVRVPVAQEAPAAKAEVEPTPIAEAEPIAQAETAPTAKAGAEVETVARAEAEPVVARAEAEPVMETAPAAEAGPIPEGEPTAEPVPTVGEEPADGDDVDRDAAAADIGEPVPAPVPPRPRDYWDVEEDAPGETYPMLPAPTEPAETTRDATGDAAPGDGTASGDGERGGAERGTPRPGGTLPTEVHHSLSEIAAQAPPLPAPSSALRLNRLRSAPAPPGDDTAV